MGEVSNTITTMLIFIASGAGLIALAFIGYIVFLRSNQFKGG